MSIHQKDEAFKKKIPSSWKSYSCFSATAYVNVETNEMQLDQVLFEHIDMQKGSADTRASVLSTGHCVTLGLRRSRRRSNSPRLVSVGDLQGQSSLVRCLIATRQKRIPSFTFVENVLQPSNALWAHGFNNPGNTNPISVHAEVGFGG